MFPNLNKNVFFFTNLSTKANQTFSIVLSDHKMDLLFKNDVQQFGKNFKLKLMLAFRDRKRIHVSLFWYFVI